MIIYEVQTLSDYIKIMLSTFENGRNDGKPLFDEYLKFFNFFNVPDDFMEMLYDDNGSAKWDGNDELLPSIFLEEFCNYRINYQINLVFPFYIVIDGYSNSQTFYELQHLQKI